MASKVPSSKVLSDKVPSDKIKVLYIAGFERSGSTIVNRVLGQLKDFVAWGELRDIWEHGKIEDRTCTCGASFHSCEAWGNILNEDFERELGLSAKDMLALKKKTRAAVLLKPFGPAGKLILNRLSADYIRGLSQLYQTIQAQTNSRVIVDSTKASWYGYILNQIPTIDLYTVHIVRDPRGVCYSLQRRKQAGEPECQWYSPLHAAMSWNLKNVGVEKLLNTGSDRYMRIRYEDFVQAPEASVKAMLDLIGEPDVALPFTEKATVKMGLDHIISGSPSSRSETGEVKLKISEKWKQAISDKDRSLIGRITSSLLGKYGYSHKY